MRDESGVLWLAKFAAAGEKLDMAWAESCTLQLAGRCGLAVPEVKVVEIGGKSVLLVRRFDRIAATTGANRFCRNNSAELKMLRWRHDDQNARL